MVVNWDFDGDLETAGVRVAGGVSKDSEGEIGTGPAMMERRKVQGTKVGAVRLALAKKVVAHQVIEKKKGKRDLVTGKRGPKPKSERVLNL